VEERQPGAQVGHHDLSPEARRQQAISWPERVREQIAARRVWTPIVTVAKRVWTGAYYDGFIHAGNLAYTAMVAVFPFFITLAAISALLGEAGQQEAYVRAFLSAVPPEVGSVIEPVARSVMVARSGSLLWLGGLVALWTVTSLIETIRDILHRAYGTPATHAFWRYRLLSCGIIFIAVIALIFSLLAQVMISAVQEAIAAWFPALEEWAITLTTSRLIPAAVLYLSMYLLFLSLTPSAYRGKLYPKWPGALLVTVWWVAVSTALPVVLRIFFTYDLTYGSLAGVMIVLFFFWLVGLGMVVGAELNAALAQTPEERDALGQADNRVRRGRTKRMQEGEE
jgi:membrane protein